jgi:hypothetical protein
MLNGKTRLAQTNRYIVVPSRNFGNCQPVLVEDIEADNHTSSTTPAKIIPKPDDDATNKPKEVSQYVFTGDCFAIAVDPTDHAKAIDSQRLSGSLGVAMIRNLMPVCKDTSSRGGAKTFPAHVFQYVQPIADAVQWSEYATNHNLLKVPVCCRVRVEEGYVISKRAVMSMQKKKEAAAAAAAAATGISGGESQTSEPEKEKEKEEPKPPHKKKVKKVKKEDEEEDKAESEEEAKEKSHHHKKKDKAHHTKEEKEVSLPSKKEKEKEKEKEKKKRVIHEDSDGEESEKPKASPAAKKANNKKVTSGVSGGTLVHSVRPSIESWLNKMPSEIVPYKLQQAAIQYVEGLSTTTTVKEILQINFLVNQAVVASIDPPTS